MADNLENLIKKAESDIQTRAAPSKKPGKLGARLPAFSVAMVIWLAAILIGAFQFDNVLSLFASPTESKIETDLGSMLSRTSSTLQNYRISNGVLPHVLSNPAIRGLVKYERRSNISYRLTATIGNVTMVMDSNKIDPYRVGAED